MTVVAWTLKAKKSNNVVLKDTDFKENGFFFPGISSRHIDACTVKLVAVSNAKPVAFFVMLLLRICRMHKQTHGA